MMFFSSTWLMIDVPNAVWRAHYSTGLLSHNGESTGRLFGFFRDLFYLVDRFNTKNVVFCFDYGKGLREQEYPSYKEARRRRGMIPEHVYHRQCVNNDINRLMTDLLPSLGFKNVFYQDGYEADDIIASICLNLPEDHEALICSTDRDLWQLLSGNVDIYNGKEVLTPQKFFKEWRIKPHRWADVKAIAGCSTDGVMGVAGVGEKTAAKFLRNELKHAHKTYQAIRAATDRWVENLRLVRLPFEGVNSFVLRKGWMNTEAWKAVAKNLGFTSLENATTR